MANIEHKNITDPNIHEPKDISTATNDQVYAANGGGSGTWKNIDAAMIDSGGVTQGKVITAQGDGTSSFGVVVWKDLLGDITPKTSGVGAPTLSTFRGGNVRAFAYSAGDDGDVIFHIPHDYKLGSDLILHLHWAHNGTAISGSLAVNCYVTYARGHNQEAFSTEITAPISVATPDIATVPQYRHRVDEIQLSAASPSGSQINSSLIEPDGIIIVHFDVATIPTITGGSPNEPFLITLDIHYQADMIGTKNKSPNFYS
jgi:hypothetical protein